MKCPGYTKGEWQIDPYNGMITVTHEKQARRIGFFQEFATTPDQRRERVMNMRLIELSSKIYERMVELYQSNQQPEDTDRQFEAMRQVEILINRMSAPAIVLPYTRPAAKRS